MAEKRHASVIVSPEWTWGIAPPIMGVTVRKNSADPTVGPRNRLNFVEGNHVGVTVTDDAGNNEVDITLTSSLAVRRNSGAVIGTRPQLNLIEGSGVTLTVADDAGSEEVDVTVASALAVRKNSGAVVGTRAQLNLIEGTGMTLTVADDGGSSEVDVTIDGPPSAGVWNRQDFLPVSQWGKRSAIGASLTTVAGILMMHTDSATAVTAPGAATRVSNGEGHWISCTTGTGAAPVDAGAPVFSNLCRRAQLPIYETRLRLPQISGAFNVWMGLSDATAGASSPQAGVNPNTLNCAGFRFFPSGTDTTWFAVSGDATAVTGQSTNTGVTVVVDTAYNLRIDMSVTGQILYYINDVLVHTESTVLPGNNTNLGTVNVIRRTSGTTDRTILWMGDSCRNTLNL